MTDYIYGEDGEEYELVDDDGLEDRLLALEPAFAGAQAAGGYEDAYEDENYYDDDDIDEEEWLDQLSGDLALLQEQIGRNLTDEEIDTLVGFAQATNVPPTESYGTIVPHLDLANEDDRISYSSQLLDQDAARQQRQEEQEAAGWTPAEAAANMVSEAGDYDAYDEGGE